MIMMPGAFDIGAATLIRLQFTRGGCCDLRGVAGADLYHYYYDYDYDYDYD